MTSKLTRERLQEIAEDGFLKHGESKELARMALAAMDSEPDCKERKLFCSTDTTRMRKTISVSAGTEDAPLYRHAQPAPVVPDDVLKALQKVARIRLDMDGFDGDRRGIADCLCDAEEALIEVVNRRAAMLAAAPQPQNAQQNIPEIIPNELIAAVNRLLDSNGSRGCYNAIKCYDAHIEVERLLAAARQEVKP